MDGLLVLVRVVLAGVLAFAATAKLASHTDVAATSVELGMPPWLSRIAGGLLLPVEIGLAVGLIFGPTAWVSSIGATVLFGAFTGLVALNVSRGRTASCNCFGTTPDAQIGWPTVVRNVVLTGGAVLPVVLGDPPGGPGVDSYLNEELSSSSVAIGLIIAAALAAVAGMFLFHLRGRVADESGSAAAARSSKPVTLGLTVGTAAPPFSVPSLFDEADVTLDELLRGEVPVMVIFMDADCGPCRTLAPRIHAWQRAHRGQMQVALLISGDRAECEDELRDLELTDVAHDVDGATRERFRVTGTPGAVVIAGDGTVAGPAAGGIGPICALARSVTGEAVVEQGQPAVAFAAESPNGFFQFVDLAGRMSLVVFWNPLCSFCQTLLPDLRIWQREQDGIYLVIASAGLPDEIRSQGFTGPVAYDPDGDLMRMFGASGTPSAVLLDASVRLASPVATGSEEVMALATRGAALSDMAAALAQSVDIASSAVDVEAS